MNLPEFLRNPGASFEFATWLRKFIEDNLPVWVTNPQQPAVTGFIRFNFDNQGGWLDITAPDSDDDGYSLQLTGEANVLLASTDSLLELQAANYIRTTYADDADFEFNGVGNGLVATIHGDGSTTITLLDTGAGAFTVKNHLGAAIFRIDENGDLHGKTGKALVFDL